MLLGLSINLFSPNQEALNKKIMKRYNLVILFTSEVMKVERESTLAFSPK